MEKVETIHGISGAPAPEIAASRIPVPLVLFECGMGRNIEGFEGESLMVALKRAGLSLPAVCGGKGACGTCKTAFPDDWAARLPEPSQRELRLLAHIKAREGERLSCRIQLTVALAGLEVDACD